MYACMRVFMYACMHLCMCVYVWMHGLNLCCGEEGQEAETHRGRASREWLSSAPSKDGVWGVERWTRFEVGRGEDSHVAQEDVRDLVYRLIPKRLGEHLVLPGLTIHEIRRSSILSAAPDILLLCSGEISGLIYPHFCMLPMGFTWALHFGHQAHRALALRTLPLVLVIEGRPPAAPLKAGDSALLFYANNANDLGTDPEMVDRQREALSKGCQQAASSLTRSLRLRRSRNRSGRASRGAAVGRGPRRSATGGWSGLCAHCPWGSSGHPRIRGRLGSLDRPQPLEQEPPLGPPLHVRVLEACEGRATSVVSVRVAGVGVVSGAHA